MSARPWQQTLRGFPCRARTSNICNAAETRLLTRLEPGRQRLLERLLNRVENARLLRRQVARKVVQESLLRQLAPIVLEDNAGCGRGHRIVLRQRRIVLVGIGSPRSDVDKGGDLRVQAHL